MDHPRPLTCRRSSDWKSVARHIGSPLLTYLTVFDLPDSGMFLPFSRFGKLSATVS